MKLLSTLFAFRNPGRTPGREPVDFVERLPLKLRNRVSGKGGKTNEVCCIHEMSVMLACLKLNEFNQSFCSKEIDSFQKCYTQHMSSKELRKEREARGILTPGEKNLSPKQINTLLKMYPNFK